MPKLTPPLPWIRAVARAHDWVEQDVLRGSLRINALWRKRQASTNAMLAVSSPWPFSRPTSPRRFWKASMLRTCHSRSSAAMYRSTGMSNALSSAAARTRYSSHGGGPLRRQPDPGNHVCLPEVVAISLLVGMSPAIELES